MPGYNHHADCGCPWCVKESGTVIPGRSWYLPPNFNTYESYTIPNARCPVCGDSVFFYQSQNGGRVYFDSLGPPWPKHPCTIQDGFSVGRCLVPQSLPPAKPEWQLGGWIPLVINRVHSEDPWCVVSARIAESGEPVRLLVHGHPSVEAGAPAAFSGWSSEGEAMFAYLESGRNVINGSAIAFRYADHFQADPALLTVEIASRLLSAPR